MQTESTTMDAYGLAVQFNDREESADDVSTYNDTTDDVSGSRYEQKCYSRQTYKTDVQEELGSPLGARELSSTYLR